MAKRKGSVARRRQRIGYLSGFVLAAVVLLIVLFPGNDRLSAAGPANTGHEALACSDCHDSAVGSPFQQLNANIRFYLNMRSAPVDFVHEPVDNMVCMDCHDKPNDRHPTYRFEEPRFKDAREAIEPQYCVSCHLEHNGMRVTQPETTFCVHCHQDLEMREDPLDVSHAELALTEQWDTCLACHDFHGNHAYEVPTQMADMYEVLEIMEYFEGGESPYGNEFVTPPLTERTSE